MPIDRRVFTAEFTLLLERFGREPHGLLIQRYFEYLDARLTTEEFTAAARKLFEEARFWPAPVEFLHAAKGDPKQLAEEAWTAMLDHAKRGEYPALETLPEATRAALKAVPLREIMYADSDIKLARLKREFIEAHVHAVGAAPAALPGVPELTQ